MQMTGVEQTPLGAIAGLWVVSRSRQPGLLVRVGGSSFPEATLRIIPRCSSRVSFVSIVGVGAMEHAIAKSCPRDFNMLDLL
jgi:hypothetical protein